MTSYSFDSLHIYGGSRLEFQPPNTGDTTVQLVTNTTKGDLSGLMYVRSGQVMTILPKAGKISFGFDVTSDVGSTIVTPERLSVEDATFTINGALSGAKALEVSSGSVSLAASIGELEHVTVGTTSSFTLATTSFSPTMPVGRSQLKTLTMDGVSASNGNMNARVYLQNGVVLQAETIQLNRGRMYVNGFVNITATTLLNLSTSVYIDGKGLSSYSTRAGPGYSGSGDYRASASHGGVGGYPSWVGTMYGSTF